MRHIILYCALLLAVLGAAVPAQAKDAAWGQLYTVSGKVSVRENPDPGALQVRVLKAGQKVRADFAEGGWIAVFDPAERVRSEMRALGYVRLAELRTGAKAEAQRGDRESREAEAPRPKKKDGKKPPEAQGFGEVRVADRTLTVRKGRDKETDFVRFLKAGQRVRVDFLEDGWYAVFDPDEKVRELARSWGFARDKYLVPESAYAGKPLPDKDPALAREAAPAKPAPKSKAGEDETAVAYSVLERQADQHRPVQSPTVLRVRLDVSAPPAAEALRKVAREIWKAERKKGEDLQLELFLPGLEQGGLAFAVARFHEDGRLKEFWWRDVVLRGRR